MYIYTVFSYSHYAISVRAASVLPIEECRLARSPKNDPHQWKELCIEGTLVVYLEIELYSYIDIVQHLIF